MPYLHERLLPAVAAGAAEAGRSPSDVDLIIPVFAIPGDTPEDRAALVERTRFQIAFYGSTRNYAFQFDDLGFEGTSARLNERMKAGDLAGMAALITDEMLEHYAVIASWDDLADALLARYDGVAARLVMYLAEQAIRADASTLPRWGEVARAVTAT